MATTVQSRFAKPSLKNKFPPDVVLNKEVFSHVVCQYQKENRLSIEDFANLMEVHRSTFYNYLKGVTAPTYKLLKQFSELLGVDLQTLGVEKVSTDLYSPNFTATKEIELNVNIKLDIEVPLSCAVQLKKLLGNFNITALN